MGPSSPNMMLRESSSRGWADHDWLRSFHTFSFASYFSPEPHHNSYGALRVINEDRVAPSTGFPPHSHSEFEIFSYVINGTIAHRDSMGNLEQLGRGSLQMTSAGTGIKHAEYNGSDKEEELHFLQIWAKPHTRGLKPKYFTRHFSDEDKKDKLVKVVAPADSEGVSMTDKGVSGPAPVHADLSMYASVLSERGKSVSHTFSSSASKGYLHLIMTGGYRRPAQPASVDGASVKVSFGAKSVIVREGDGLYLDNVAGQDITLESDGPKPAEFVLFEL